MPQQESRVKKSLLNARVNLIFYFLTLILSFFSRKIFLDTLGADFVGLTGTLQNLLGFLNLAELGIGSAIGYVLYKPLFEHDEGKINEIISVFGYLYRWIGFIILGAGIVLACFLPLIFPNTEFEMGVIFFAYFSFLASSLIGYLPTTNKRFWEPTKKIMWSPPISKQQLLLRLSFKWLRPTIPVVIIYGLLLNSPLVSSILSY